MPANIAPRHAKKLSDIRYEVLAMRSVRRCGPYRPLAVTAKKPVRSTSTAHSSYPIAHSGYRIESIYRRLFTHYGPQHWWPAGSAWEMMAGAILTQNTSWSNVEKAIAALRRAGAHRGAPFPSVATIASMPKRKMEKLIRSSGYFRQKAKRLKEFARVMAADRSFHLALCGRAHRGAPLHVLRDRLLSLHGIGPETADAMLLYAGGHPTFVVDAYTRRIGQRQGLFKTDDYDEVQAYFLERLPRDAVIYNEMHALIVRLAKEVCTKRDPRCGICPVRKDCRFHNDRLSPTLGRG